nr:hypothetical protein [Prevotella sp.]
MKNFKNLLLGVGLMSAMLSSCGSAPTSALTLSGLIPAAFDSTIYGKDTKLIVLKNNKGMEVCLTNYGGRVVSLCVPDKNSIES